MEMIRRNKVKPVQTVEYYSYFDAMIIKNRNSVI